MERYILANSKRMFDKKEYDYCPYCGNKLKNESLEKYTQYSYGIDYGICHEEMCTKDFINKCMYLREE